MEQHVNSPWIAHPQHHQDASINFFCFPYAGGSPSMFSPWRKELPDTINVFPVSYPQRELRKKEPMPANIELFIKQFVDQTIDLFTDNFILFGHCTGALIAYQVLLEVRQRLGREPLALIVSGAESPRFLMQREREIGKELLSDSKLIARMVAYDLVDQETAQSAIFSQYYLPIYKTDLAMLATYEYHEEKTLTCPIYVVSGDNDQTLRPEAVTNWSLFSDQKVTFQIFAGKHFYFSENKRPLLHYLQELIAYHHLQIKENQAHYD